MKLGRGLGFWYVLLPPLILSCFWSQYALSYHCPILIIFYPSHPHLPTTLCANVQMFQWRTDFCGLLVCGLLHLATASLMSYAAAEPEWVAVSAAWLRNMSCKLSLPFTVDPVWVKKVSTLLPHCFCSKSNEEGHLMQWALELCGTHSSTLWLCYWLAHSLAHTLQVRWSY